MREREREGHLLNPKRKDPFRSGVPRRRVLASSAAVGATVSAAGCLGEDGTGGADGDGAETVFVFNNGDRTVSIIDAAADELLDTVFLGTTASFPANQYGTGADDDYGVLWLNVAGGVRAFEQATLNEVAYVETGYGPNYPNLTPDGRHLLVASGGTLGMDPSPTEPESHAIFRIDADPASDSFGEVTGELTTEYVGPCDMTIGPDGEYAFVVDVAGERLRVVRVDPFETVARVAVGEPAYDGNVLPFMCTASFDGETLLVENGEGELGPDGERRGSESIWDVSDPTDPVERVRLTRDDGFGGLPITSEISEDGTTGYVFAPAVGVVVLDIEAGAIEGTIDIGGSAIAGTWGPHRRKLYVPVQDGNQVAVIDDDDREVVATIDAGESPTGAVAGMVRPESDATASLQARIASLGLPIGEMQATHCHDEFCYCG